MSRRLSACAAVFVLGMAACKEGPTETEPLPNATYYEDVAPILNRACVSCHVEGGIAPFALDSYEAAKDVSSGIKAATADRRMPPISVDTSGDCNTFDDPRILSDGDIATIAGWVENGVQEGDPANAPPKPEAIVLPDVTVTVDPGVEYMPNTSASDDYRCFVIDAVSDEDAFLTAYEVHPDKRTEVHHVVLFSTDSEAEEQAAVDLDAAEEGPGYTCFGGSMTGGGRTLAVWAPGTGATFYPEGTGLRVLGGRKLVMQVHYNQPTLPDRSTIDSKLSDSVPLEAIITGVLDFDLNLQPNQDEAVERATIPLEPSALSYKIWGVYPHMHTLGRTMHVELQQGGQDECIVDVPRYDFGYQQFFFYEDPLVIEAGPGGSVSIECTYDTRGSTQTVHWGEGTHDEMCIAAFYVTL